MTFEDYVIKSHPTGSNYICNPPVTDTDIDTVFLLHSELFAPGAQIPKHYSDQLVEDGWTPCVGEGYEILGGDFTAWRKGNFNYICTTDEKYYKKYVFATKVCKAMNIKYKPARIWMFEVIMERKHMPKSATYGDLNLGTFWHQALQGGNAEVLINPT